MRASLKVVELIREEEGFSNKPYLCPANVPTIGYGTTKYPNGASVQLTDSPISEEIARGFLLHELEASEKYVSNYVKVKLKQNQFDALVDFVYNLGPSAFQNSTLLKLINSGDLVAAANEFPKWNKARVKGVLKELPGLTRRRGKEQQLFLS